MAERFGWINLGQSKLAGAEQIMQTTGEGPKA
jgi:hypothetical protein